MNSSASIPSENALLGAYEEWRRLGELEGEGIRAHDWTLVADCQRQLSVLQTRIIRLTNQAREDWNRLGADLTQKEDNLRQTVSSLIELEMRNSSSLAEAKDAAREQIGELDVARQNLKRVQRSYSQTGSGVLDSFT